MLIEDEKEYELIWNRVYKKLKFKPSCDYRGHSFNVELPFKIEGNYSVFGIKNMKDKQIDKMDKIIKDIFREITKEGELMYALDWQHEAFLFDPRKEEECNAYFPSLYPDGDYSFFLHECFEFGYLGHPWRQEVWVFGDKIISKIDKLYKILGWEKLR